MDLYMHLHIICKGGAGGVPGTWTFYRKGGKAGGVGGVPGHDIVVVHEVGHLLGQGLSLSTLHPR